MKGCEFKGGGNNKDIEIVSHLQKDITYLFLTLYFHSRNNNQQKGVNLYFIGDFREEEN